MHSWRAPDTPMLRAGNCASSGIVPCHGEAARQGRALRRSACRECGVRGRVCDGVQCVLVHGAVSLVRPHGRLRTPRTGGAERSGFTVVCCRGAVRGAVRARATPLLLQGGNARCHAGAARASAAELMLSAVHTERASPRPCAGGLRARAHAFTATACGGGGAPGSEL